MVSNFTYDSRLESNVMFPSNVVDNSIATFCVKMKNNRRQYIIKKCLKQCFIN